MFNWRAMMAGALLLSSAPAWSAEISVSNGLISIHAESEPFNRVMKELGQVLGCKVVMPAIADPVSISRTEVTLKVVFRELLRGYQHAVFWADAPSGEVEKVEKILVMAAEGNASTSARQQMVYEPVQVTSAKEELAGAASEGDQPDPASVGGRIEKLANLMGTENGVQETRQALQDPSPEVRLAALDLLFGQGDANARQMIESALADTDQNVRKAANQMLADFDEIYSQ